VSRSARQFTHPKFGKEVRVEQHGREVRLIFLASTQAQADDLRDDLRRQLAAGRLYLALIGKTTSIRNE
jgi:hypothetical protein